MELERLDDVVYVRRPAFGQPNGTVGLFRMEADGQHAARTPVKLGRNSVNFIEVVEGLRPGDEVVLSDMSQWASHDRVRPLSCTPGSSAPESGEKFRCMELSEIDPTYATCKGGARVRTVWERASAKEITRQAMKYEATGTIRC
ncbi:MAG: hypothetical protein U5J83_17655 [Bryobacterales bacterium]|nr:hypothetical protein [Bryobacterales bacterium]